jgi:hypothetical protein
MAPIVRPAWGFTSIDFLDLAYSMGTTAHWPLSDTSWTNSLAGNINEVLGGSDGTKDYWVDTNTSTYEPPISVSGLGILEGTATQYSDTSARRVVDTNHSSSDHIKLGNVTQTGSDGTMTVWFMLNSPYTDISNAFVVQNMIRLGGGSQVIGIYDNDGAADTLGTNIGSLGTVQSLLGIPMFISHTAAGRLVICSNGSISHSHNSAGTWSGPNWREMMLRPIVGNWNSPPADNRVTYQHAMFFDGVNLTDDQVLTLHKAGLGL